MVVSYCKKYRARLIVMFLWLAIQGSFRAPIFIDLERSIPVPKLFNQVTFVVTGATQVALLGFLPSEKAQAASFSLEEATINSINDAFESGGLTSETLTQLYLERINAYDKNGPKINSIIALNPNALKTAAELDRELQLTGSRSPLHGIPILLKDNYNTFDLPTTVGSALLEGSIPPDDAFTVKQFREAGAVILGKANMSEWAWGIPPSLIGATLNPYKPNRSTTLGSSGGTGAAIAANFAVVGTGSDTGGSIRGPAAANSLVGVKPTLGLVSRDGIVPLALSFDTGGPMARTVTDAAITPSAAHQSLCLGEKIPRMNARAIHMMLLS